MGRGQRALVLLFVTLGIAYFVIMMFGVFTVRVPPQDWRPPGFDPASVAAKPLVTTASVSASNAIRTPVVLAAVGRAVLQRDRGHRHPRAGQSDDPGLLPPD